MHIFFAISSYVRSLTVHFRKAISLNPNHSKAYYNCALAKGHLDDYPSAISRADYFIQKYYSDGLTNPDLMRDRWVGWPNPNWPLAVETVARELEDKGI